jgi:mRNA interferase YafQ
MSLKRSTDKKRAALPLSSDITKPFQKDWDRLSESGRYDLKRLKEVMALLVANDGPLPHEYLDHALSGKWANHRECHVGGDFLLIYIRSNKEIVFVRAGTHAELFS